MNEKPGDDTVQEIILSRGYGENGRRNPKWKVIKDQTNPFWVTPPESYFALRLDAYISRPL